MASSWRKWVSCKRGFRLTYFKRAIDSWKNRGSSPSRSALEWIHSSASMRPDFFSILAHVFGNVLCQYECVAKARLVGYRQVAGSGPGVFAADLHPHPFLYAEPKSLVLRGH